MRKGFVAAVVVAGLSAGGMLYSYHFRHPCKADAGTISRDWRGDCYLIVTADDAKAVGDTFTAEIIEQRGWPERYKWIKGKWRPLPPPLHPY